MNNGGEKEEEEEEEEEQKEQEAYGQMKRRMSETLGSLRLELDQIHEQDLELFRQLMNIHSVICELSGPRYRRSYSSMDTQSLCRRPALMRGCSDPVFQEDVHLTGVDDIDRDDVEEEEEYRNVLIESFNSAISEPAKTDKPSTTANVRCNTASLPVPFCHELVIDSVKRRSKNRRTDDTNCERCDNQRNHIELTTTTTTATATTTTTTTTATTTNNTGSKDTRLWCSTLLKRSSQIWKDMQGNSERIIIEDDMDVLRQEVFL